MSEYEIVIDGESVSHPPCPYYGLVVSAADELIQSWFCNKCGRGGAVQWTPTCPGDGVPQMCKRKDCPPCGRTT